MHSTLELGMFRVSGMFFGRSYFEFLYSKITVRKIHYCIVPVYSILVIILTLGRHVFCIYDGALFNVFFSVEF